MEKCVFCRQFFDDASSVELVCEECFQAKSKTATPSQVEASMGNASEHVQWLRDQEIDRWNTEMIRRVNNQARRLRELVSKAPVSVKPLPTDDGGFEYDEEVDNRISFDFGKGVF